MSDKDKFTVDASVSALLSKEDAERVAPRLTCSTCGGTGTVLSMSTDAKGHRTSLGCFGCLGKGWV